MCKVLDDIFNAANEAAIANGVPVVCVTATRTCQRLDTLGPVGDTTVGDHINRLAGLRYMVETSERDALMAISTASGRPFEVLKAQLGMALLRIHATATPMGGTTAQRRIDSDHE